MAVLQYVGARYVPVFYKNPDGSWDWEPGVDYEPLSIVMYGTNTYISRSQVPSSVGSPNENPAYWAQTGEYNGSLLEIQTQIDMLKASEMLTPEQYGATGNGIADDTQALIDCINAAHESRKAIYLGASYYIAGDLTIKDKNIVFYGSSAGIPNLISSPLPNSHYNLIMGGALNTMGIGSVTMIGVGIKNSNFNLQSFRNTFILCGFSDSETAITISKGSNWSGENRILHCFFHNVQNCISCTDASDGHCIGNISDGSCGNFITGTASGWLYSGNHDYGTGKWSINASNAIITNNYFDGFNKLEITSPSYAIVKDNMFIGNPSPPENSWCINFTTSTKTVNKSSFTGNTLFTESANVAMFNFGNLSYFSGDISGCKVTGGILYYGDPTFDGTNFGDYNAGVLNIRTSKVTINQSYGIISGLAYIGYADVELRSVDGVNCLRFMRKSGPGIAFVKLNNSETWHIKVMNGNNFNFTDGDYSSATQAYVFVVGSSIGTV